MRKTPSPLWTVSPSLYLLCQEISLEKLMSPPSSDWQDGRQIWSWEPSKDWSVWAQKQPGLDQKIFGMQKSHLRIKCGLNCGRIIKTCDFFSSTQHIVCMFIVLSGFQEKRKEKWRSKRAGRWEQGAEEAKWGRLPFSPRPGETL